MYYMYNKYCLLKLFSHLKWRLSERVQSMYFMNGIIVTFWKLAANIRAVEHEKAFLWGAYNLTSFSPCHWSSGLPVCFLSQGTRVQFPWRVLMWNWDSLVRVVSLHVNRYFRFTTYKYYFWYIFTLCKLFFVEVEWLRWNTSSYLTSK
jgi:hypothetical protein